MKKLSLFSWVLANCYTTIDIQPATRKLGHDFSINFDAKDMNKFIQNMRSQDSARTFFAALAAAPGVAQSAFSAPMESSTRSRLAYPRDHYW